ncbi:MAG: hypothetical protein Q4B85_06545 [Lachnospiraceae bacterium]|nr:hypothetical protein [Lachnospiraceae bacterium]
MKELAALLLARKVEFTWTEQAAALLKELGTSREFGAREMDRVIQDRIKPQLVDQLLFGRLKKGGAVVLDTADREFVIL